MRSIKLSDYFKLVKPTYVYLQITPHKSIRNYNSANISKAIAHTYRAINRRIYKQQKKLFFETNYKISYVIDIKDNNAKFYFIIPDIFKNIVIEKCKEIWGKATIEIVDKIEEMQEDTDMYSLSYKKEDAMSLAVDKKSNEPLNSILSVMDIMKDDDRIRVIYNFLPISQFGWLDRYNTTIEKIKEHKSIEKKQMSFDYIMRSAIINIFNLFDSIVQVINDFTGGAPEGNKQSLYSAILGILEQQQNLSSNTNKKKEATVLNTQIAIQSQSKDLTRRENNALSVAHGYRTLDEDNELIYKKEKHKLNIEDYDFKIDTNTMSTDECSNFLQIPGKMLLLQHGIKHINVEENKVPEELKNGYISLGENTYRGNKINTFLEDHKEIGTLPLMLLGRQGGGKTTYLCNYANYAQGRDESIIHIDFIRNNEASKDVEKVVSKDKVIVLDFSKQEHIQSLAYNEIKFTSDMNWYNKQQLANKKTQLTIELVNSINETGEPLSPKMERFLCATTDIVYLNENATFKDVIKCLQDYRYREKIVDSVPDELKEELEEEIETLKELDEWGKGTKDTPPEKIGTRDSKIEGILDRITLLKKDFNLKKMFNISPENNIDFVKAMEEGKVILIRMPQSKFKNYVKNVITTFIVTKCWLACELRGELSERSKRSHIIIDEISQTKTAERYMENILTQTRKFGMKFVLAGQYLDQLDKKTIYSLKGAGTSFMLLKGTIKEDYEYFKDELDGTYEYEDLKDMEEHSSLNIIQYSKGYSSFITKLPKPI